MPRDSAATVDALFDGKGYGSVAQRLLSCGFKTNGLRTNTTLRKDEWKELDEALVQISRQRLIGVNDLVRRGLVYNVRKGLGATVLEYEDISDFTDAELTMDGANRSRGDRVEFSLKTLPLPIIHKDFQISARVLQASRDRGQSLDTTQTALAGVKISEKAEDLLFNGSSDYTFGGGTIYGYTDFPNRSTEGFGTNGNWAAGAKTGENILADVITMKQASLDDRHYGPWVIYVPTAYEAKLDNDFKANSDLTIRQRILQVQGIESVIVADRLTGDNVIMAEMRPETVRMVIGLQPTNVEWQVEGGMILHFKSMMIMVPQLRADQENRSGIVHMS